MENVIAMKRQALHLMPTAGLWILFICMLFSMAHFSSALPTGPDITIYDNSTKTIAPGRLVNSTVNGTLSPGGFIFTSRLTALQQNTRWKAYVGNVTGTLTLDDASDNTLFQWSIASISGEVYATRSSGTINWTGMNCTWIADGQHNPSQGLSLSNRTPEHNENMALSHTSQDDNVTATFRVMNHSALSVGTRTIGKNECFSAVLWQRDSAQTYADSDQANFTQTVLYDGAFNTTNGNLVYATKIQNDITGYRADSTYDFQLMVPESGAQGFASSTAYYFYVELT